MGMIIALDLGGVVIDILDAKRRELIRELNRHITIDQALKGSFKHLVSGPIYKQAMRRLYTTEDFLSFCAPYEGVQEVLEHRRNCGDKIWFVSQAHGLKEELLGAWCHAHSVSYDRLVTSTSDKRPYYSAAHVVVDDTPRHLKPHVNLHKGKLIVFRHETRAENHDPVEDSLPIVGNWRHLGEVFAAEAAQLMAA